MVNLVIELKHLRFIAFHGVYENEKKVGNEFEVNLKVVLKPAEKIITKLDQSVNYLKLFDIVKNKMSKPTMLLETWAMEAADQIHAEFKTIKEIELSITKVHPPIENFTGSVAVTYRKQF